MIQNEFLYEFQLIPTDAPESSKEVMKPLVPVTQVGMARCIDNEIRLINEVCENACCLEGHYEKCNKSHQVIKRSVKPSNGQEDVPENDNSSFSAEDETEMIHKPLYEFDHDFKYQDAVKTDIESDQEIELSDSEDELNDSIRNERRSNMESSLEKLKRFILQIDIKEYLSNDLTMKELKPHNLNHESFIRHMSGVLSNQNTFGSRGFYLEDLDSLTGTEWLTDTVMDAMLSIIQNKALSLGNPVVSIPCLWFYVYKVCQYSIF